ncbi:TldD/PmbA family protein [Palaeococcus ferrophilus]|uniref:TldD/PmbA family protein n=1 Tax=Palaeococcus ferrophilus TaxID=83868 RepID=UPI00064E9D34|nr:TldD/PmbA family protein [Palaeococcus ferrophilus]
MEYEAIVRKAEELARRHGIDYYEVRIVRTTALGIHMQNSELEELSANTEVGIGVRAFKGSWGFSSANDLSRAEKAIETAMKIARLSGGSSRVYEGDPVKDRAVIPMGRPFDDVSLEEKLELVREIDGHLMGEGISNRSVSYGEGVKRQFYFNSVGSEVETVVPRARLFFSATAKENAEMQSYWKIFGGTGGWEIIERVNVEEWASFVKEKALSLLRASPPPSGEFEVIADPELAGVFIHEAIGHAAEADAVKTGESILAGRLGERIGVEGLTVVDDPTLPGRFGSYVYDDEGIKARRVEIIKDGVLLNYLNDRETSAVLNLEPNGHGRAQSYAHQPLVRMSNTFIEPGDWSFEEMVAEVRRGLYMVGDKGGEVDIANGTFTFGAKEGYLIENGEIKAHLRDVALSGKILDVLREIRAIGKDLRVDFPGYCGKGQWVPVDDGGPHILTRALVGGLK